MVFNDNKAHGLYEDLNLILEGVCRTTEQMDEILPTEGEMTKIMNAQRKIVEQWQSAEHPWWEHPWWKGNFGIGKSEVTK